MTDLNSSFSILQNRLYSLTNQSVYIQNFNIEKVIEELKLRIWDMPDILATEKLKKCLYKIEKLQSVEYDFHSNFLKLHETRIESSDEYGNICYEEIKEYIPLPKETKQSINNDIKFELSYYQINLSNLLRDFETYAPQAEENTQKPVRDTACFQYLHYNTDPSKITDLYKSLKRHQFIEGKTTLKSFKNIFNCNNNSEKKIWWIGNASELTYFLKTLTKRKILNCHSGLGIWQATKMLFTLHDDGREINVDLASQHSPKQRKQILDTIIKAFS